LILFGASDTSLQYALAYFRIYIIGTVFSMLAIGLNPFINAEGFPVIGMVTVAIGAVLNLILDPIFIFSLGLEIRGAAFATLISQVVSAIFVISFLKSKRSEYGIKILSFRRLLALKKEILNVLGLGMTSFIMQVTNSLVQIACNSVLGKTGGDIYISIMALVSSIRQMLEVPLLALVEGSSPVISFNYGAGDYRRVKKAGAYMFLFEIVYALLIWGAIIVFPHFFIAIFSDDASLLEKTQAAVKIYFSTFVFMTFQYTGQTMFKSLNMKRQAIFFSLLRKVVIVIPLTYILPYSFGFGTDGVFMAEPVSNVLGGLASFLTMLFVTRKLLRKKDVEL
jgi:Na+-driven multidrug efflux pump